jgi:hypothetical protein
MKKCNFGVAAVLGLLSVAAMTNAASAQCPPIGGPSSPMIEFDANAFSYETLYTAAGFNSAPGSQLTIVGIIDQFYAPLAFLNPADPTKEYTFVVTGLTSLGTVLSVNGPTNIYQTSYTGGTFAIYEGSPENAPLAAAMGSNPPGGATVPANFQDGTTILTGALCGFTTTVTKTGAGLPNGSFTSTYHFTNPNAPGAPPAGNLYNTMGGADAVFGGLWCVRTGGCTPTGYSAHPNGKWDSPPSTPSKQSTWGMIKTLYR